MHAQIVLFDGFDPLDVIAPYEVLYAGGTASGGAGERGAGLRRRAARGGQRRRGPGLRATAALDPARAGLVLVPGAAGRTGDRRGPRP